MTFKYFLAMIGIATLVAWVAWIVVLFTMDPTRAGFLAFVIFDLTLFISLFGTILIAGVCVRYLFNKQEIVSRLVSRSCRQSFLLSALVVGCLILLSQGLFNYITGTCFVVFVGLMETFFISAGHQRTKHIDNQEGEEECEIEH